MKFGEIIRDLREERELTQKEVAFACDLTPTCICQLENGTRKPTGSTVRALAIYFGVSADYLLELSNDFGAVVPPSAVPPLSAEEREILTLYNNLDHMGKKYVRQTLEILNGGASDIAQKKKNS